MLLDRENPGSWPNVFSDFKVHADFESIGKLDKLAKKNTERYKNIFIDEAPSFPHPKAMLLMKIWPKSVVEKESFLLLQLL